MNRILRKRIPALLVLQFAAATLSLSMLPQTPSSMIEFTPDRSLRFPSAPPIHAAPGLVTDWEISEPLKKRRLDFDRYPDPKALGLTRWTKVKAQPTGIQESVQLSDSGRNTENQSGVVMICRKEPDFRGPEKNILFQT